MFLRVIKLFYCIWKNKKIKKTLDIKLIFFKVIKLYYCSKKNWFILINIIFLCLDVIYKKLIPLGFRFMLIFNVRIKGYEIKQIRFDLLHPRGQSQTPFKFVICNAKGSYEALLPHQIDNRNGQNNYTKSLSCDMEPIKFPSGWKRPRLNDLTIS